MKSRHLKIFYLLHHSLSGKSTDPFCAIKLGSLTHWVQNNFLLKKMLSFLDPAMNKKELVPTSVAGDKFASNNLMD